MELRHLRYFVAVADALSFTKAAQKLRLAQPSLTRQVRNLENEIGVLLFDRSKNRVALTDEGSTFLPDAKKLLAASEEMVAALQPAHRAKTTQLNLGYVADFHSSFFPATLGAFRKLWPRVAINLFDLTSAEQFAALETRQIDLGLVGLSPIAPLPHLLTERVGHDTIFVALPTHHPLARKKKIHLTDLSGLFFIGMAAQTHPGVRAWLIAVCHEASFVPQILQETGTELAALKFVADGLGVALLPQPDAAPPQDHIVFRPLSPALHRDSTIAWRADNLSKPLQDYLKILRDLT